MRLISTPLHATFDYSGGFLLMIFPWLFGVSDYATATWTLWTLGTAMIVMAAITDYELSIVCCLPLSIHLGIDMAIAAIVSISPWLCRFAEIVWLPFVLMGFAGVINAAATEASGWRDSPDSVWAKYRTKHTTRRDAYNTRVQPRRGRQKR